MMFNSNQYEKIVLVTYEHTSDVRTFTTPC